MFYRILGGPHSPHFDQKEENEFGTSFFSHVFTVFISGDSVRSKFFSKPPLPNTFQNYIAGGTRVISQNYTGTNAADIPYI